MSRQIDRIILPSKTATPREQDQRPPVSANIMTSRPIQLRPTASLLSDEQPSSDAESANLSVRG